MAAARVVDRPRLADAIEMLVLLVALAQRPLTC